MPARSPTRAAALDRRATRDALDAGIAIVMQETSLAPDLSVLENIFLPELGRTRPALLFAPCAGAPRTCWRRLGQSTRCRSTSTCAPFRRAAPAGRDRQGARRSSADLIIFDEPTASLSPSEVERLFDIMARLRDGGKALVFVSHRLEEVFAITDRVTILREGRTVLADRRHRPR